MGDIRRRRSTIWYLLPHGSQTQDGKLRLDIVVSEAKYISASNLSRKKEESQKQLRDTLNRIADALFGQPERLDKPL